MKDSRELLQNRAKLNLGSAVTPGGFKVPNAQFQCPGHDLLEIGLVFRRDGLRRILLPSVLKAHATAGQDRHGQTGPSEAAGGNHSPGKERRA